LKVTQSTSQKRLFPTTVILDQSRFAAQKAQTAQNQILIEICINVHGTRHYTAEE
jgi:hypothetical protein